MHPQNWLSIMSDRVYPPSLEYNIPSTDSQNENLLYNLICNISTDFEYFTCWRFQMFVLQIIISFRQFLDGLMNFYRDMLLWTCDQLILFWTFDYGTSKPKGSIFKKNHIRRNFHHHAIFDRLFAKIDCLQIKPEV